MKSKIDDVVSLISQVLQQKSKIKRDDIVKLIQNNLNSSSKDARKIYSSVSFRQHLLKKNIVIEHGGSSPGIHFIGKPPLSPGRPVILTKVSKEPLEETYKVLIESFINSKNLTLPKLTQLLVKRKIFSELKFAKKFIKSLSFRDYIKSSEFIILKGRSCGIRLKQDIINIRSKKLEYYKNLLLLTYNKPYNQISQQEVLDKINGILEGNLRNI